MAINMDKMRQKKNLLENRGSGNSNVNFWRPTDNSETTIRILPTSDGDPFKEFWFHYNLEDAQGNKVSGFLSPKKNFNEDDPLDDYIRSLFGDGSEESIKMAKDLMARQRFFSPVIVRGEEDKGVQVWGYGKMVYQNLLNLVLNPEYGDITDPEEGTDLVIHYGKPAGAQFPQTKITPRRRPSNLTEDEEKSAQMLEDIPDFKEIFERKTPEAVQQILDDFLLRGDTPSDTEETRFGGNGTTETAVDRAFSELTA